MTLEFTEAVFGTEKEFEAPHLETCDSCSGSGAKAGSSRKDCSVCGGIGQIMATSQTPFGTFSQVYCMPYLIAGNLARSLQTITLSQLALTRHLIVCMKSPILLEFGVLPECLLFLSSPE